MLSLIRKFVTRSPQPLTVPGSTAELGAYGEQLAVAELKRQGYRIVATNYTAPVGRSLSGREVTGEIDIIAYDDTGDAPVLVFIEVKTRRSAEFALPQAAVDARKQRQIVRAGRVFRRVLRLGGEPYRYDVVTVIVSGSVPPEVTLLRDYFHETRFSRSSWWLRRDERF